MNLNSGVFFRRLLVAGCASLLLASLGGCTQRVEASNLKTPDILWADGEPSGQFWDTEWAAAYREATTQRALADAYGDYSDPDLIAAVGYDSALAGAESNADRRFGSVANQHRQYDPQAIYAYFGTILSLTESADGKSAVVGACAPRYEGSEIVPMAIDWLITKNTDGSFYASLQFGSTGNECHDAHVWIGAWAEAIDIENVGRDEVKMPLPRDYYVKLGVISE